MASQMGTPRKRKRKRDAEPTPGAVKLTDGYVEHTGTPITTNATSGKLQTSLLPDAKYKAFMGRRGGNNSRHNNKKRKKDKIGEYYENWSPARQGC